MEVLQQLDLIKTIKHICSSVHESLATLENSESLRTQAATRQFILALLAS